MDHLEPALPADILSYVARNNFHAINPLVRSCRHMAMTVIGRDIFVIDAKIPVAGHIVKTTQYPNGWRIGATMEYQNYVPVHVRIGYSQTPGDDNRLLHMRCYAADRKCIVDFTHGLIVGMNTFGDASVLYITSSEKMLVITSGQEMCKAVNLARFRVTSTVYIGPDDSPMIAELQQIHQSMRGAPEVGLEESLDRICDLCNNFIEPSCDLRGCIMSHGVNNGEIVDWIMESARSVGRLTGPALPVDILGYIARNNFHAINPLVRSCRWLSTLHIDRGDFIDSAKETVAGHTIKISQYPNGWRLSASIDGENIHPHRVQMEYSQSPGDNNRMLFATNYTDKQVRVIDFTHRLIVGIHNLNGSFVMGVKSSEKILFAEMKHTWCKTIGIVYDAAAALYVTAADSPQIAELLQIHRSICEGTEVSTDEIGHRLIKSLNRICELCDSFIGPTRDIRKCLAAQVILDIDMVDWLMKSAQIME